MTQPNALFLADILEDGGKPADIAEKCAAELRRLHAELERCKQVCAATSEAWREEAALAEPAQQGCDHCNQPLYAAIKCRVCGRVTSAEPPCATRECMPSECPNCASLEAQNSELDQKLAEMERKLLELQAAVFRSQGIGN